MDKIKIILGKILINSLDILFTFKYNHHPTNVCVKTCPLVFLVYNEEGYICKECLLMK